MNAPGRRLPQKSKQRLFGWVASGVVAALVVTLAVVASGFDSRETPREDPSVWVERMAGQYARVNTETAEIDTVRVAESPSGVVQTNSLGLLLTQGFGRAYPINPASPSDVHDDGAASNQAGNSGDEDPAAAAQANASGDGSQGADATPVSDTPAAGEGNAATGSAEGAEGADQAEGSAAMRTPDGTREVIAAADRVLFFTQSGDAYVSQVRPAEPGAAATLSSPSRLDPLAKERESAGPDEEVEKYLANAAALDELGRVALFSQAEQAVRWYDAAAQKWVGGESKVPDGVPAEDVQLAIVDGEWVLFDPASGQLWRQGASEPVAIGVSGAALLQGSSAATGDVLIADEAGLWQIDSAGGVERIADASGVAARPRYVGDQAIAAWVGISGAQMWTSDAGDVSLQLDDSIEDLNNPEPEVRTNGSRALIVERRTGMMWTVPDGRLIPVEQWSLIDPPKQETGTVVTQDVTEQEPPVAVNDAFGVRAGEPALLPLLLNDFDPNRKDVLTVVPEGLGEGLGDEFGGITALSDGQGVVVQPSESARGSSSFSYRITDGVNVSAPATVTLTVVDDATNTAPQWCPVEGCQRAWPSPEVAPGGTLILPILEGWVDPEGDPMMLASATVVGAEDPLRALVTAEGKLAVRHTDPNAGAGDSVVRVKVIDSHGAATERDLRVRVRAGAAIEFAPAAATAKIGEMMPLRPLERVTGGSGSFQLVDATVQQGTLTATANQGTGVVEVTATEPGNTVVTITVRDTVTEQETTGVIRVTAVDVRAPFAVPPLRAFVRALADSTVDVLSAIPGANSRALTVRSAIVRDGQLRADVIEHSSVRVSGSTFDGQPGRIGSVDVIIAEGDLTAKGHLTVFQVDEVGVGAIAVTDTATVRAGSVVDIPVLENDVSPPGDRLVLHPEIGAPGAEGELAFASGSRVRYLAPKEPGVYTLSYTTYGASSPEHSDVGQVRVTVLAAGSNRNPQPATVTVRVAPGEMVKTPIPLSGVDPDGDRVRLVSVDTPEDAQLSTSILARSNSVQVAASASAQRGTGIVGYTVRDSFGGEAGGKIRIIVTEPDSGGGAPVVYSDYVRMAAGSADFATVRPLDNDLDPSGGRLNLVSVEPNVPGGEESPLYRELMQRLDLAATKQGIVRVRGGDDLGTVSFKYTVRSSQTKSTADGLIVVQVSERIGQQAPSVTDTVLSVRDRADFEKAGVDVVTDRVRWAGGDVSTLKLSLWGAAESKYRISGSSIIGSYKAEGDLVPFRLAGTDITGTEVETFGFLVVPPLDELRLSLKSTAAALSVAENKSIDANIVDMLDLGPGDRVELDQSSFTTQRQQASCVAVNETTIRYSAGKEAPWADSCTVRVRLTVQKTYTSIPIAIAIVPDDPVVQLNPLTRTVAPGAAETINLVDMVQWQGGREGDVGKLRFEVSGGSEAFEVAPAGAQVQVTARADAVPGSQSVLTIGVSGSGESQSLLTLRVGEAAVDAPRGGTVSLQCTVGASCGTSLVGVGGEYDPFAGKSGGGLHLVSVDGGGCQFGALQASGDSVSVSWADARGPGGRCTASFTVRDAQNRTGTGTIEFDAQGVPRAPANIAATGADATSVTLTVSLNSQTAHPDVTGVEILGEGGGVVASCSPSGGVAVCTVSGVPVGIENARTYRARAVNAVGASDPTANTSAPTWAYQAPPAPTVVATPVKDKWNTDTTIGKVRLDISGSDRARRFLLEIDGGARVEVGRSGELQLAPGPHTFRVIPQDQDLPPGYSGTSEGDAGTASATVGAAPIIQNATLSPTGDTSAEITFSVNANYADPATVQQTFGASSGNWLDCSSNDPSFTGLDKYKTYTGKICVQTEFGRSEVTTGAVWIGGNPPELTVNRGYTIGSSVSDYGNVREYTTVSGWGSQPQVSGAVNGATIRYITSAGTSDGSLSSVPVGSDVQVQQCLTGNGTEYCSNPVAVAAEGQLPTRVTWSGTCVADGGNYGSVFTIEGRAAADATFAKQGSQNIRLSWVSGFDRTDFAGAICPTAPDPPPDPPTPDPPTPDPPPAG